MYNAQQYVADVDAADLLKKMLEPDPTKRITAQEALKHAYLGQGEKQIFQSEQLEGI